MIHPMILPIITYLACQENPNLFYFYSDYFGEMDGVVWEAVNTMSGMEASNPEARSKIGWLGFPAILSGI